MWNWSKSWELWYRRALPAYWIYLFCATHFPKAKLTGHVPSEDKLAHLLSFGVLAFLLWRFAESFRRPVSRRFFWMAAFWLGAYAAADEYLQGFVNRSPSVGDWFADMLGILAVLIPLEVHRRRSATVEQPEG